MKKKILISTGGSGGHVIPAISFYEHLKENFDVSLVVDQRGHKFINKNKFNNFFYIFCFTLFFVFRDDLFFFK